MKNKSFINFAQLKSVSSVTESKETHLPPRAPPPLLAWALPGTCETILIKQHINFRAALRTFCGTSTLMKVRLKQLEISRWRTRGKLWQVKLRYSTGRGGGGGEGVRSC